MMIRRVASAEELDKVGTLRYRVYVDEMGRHQNFADHARKVVLEPFDQQGRVLAAFDRSTGEAIGTIRINIGSESQFYYYDELYNLTIFRAFYPGQISVTTKLIVAPQWRNSTLPLKLCLAAWDEGYAAGVAFDCIDCKPWLKQFFEKFGWHRCSPILRDPDYGEASPMILAGHDWKHLERVGSPFAKRVKKGAQSIRPWSSSTKNSPSAA